jgi:hypothetical protein
MLGMANRIPRGLAHRQLSVRREIAAGIVLLVAAACGSTPPSPAPSAPLAVASPMASAQVALPSPSPTPQASPSASPSASPTPTPAPAELAQPGYATLDGVKVADSLGHRLPVAVMVDDNISARPQYGFNRASIVYQAPADGGETRYMMVFQEQNAPRVEPIRSGRPYFVNWASEYHAAFAHYGGDWKTTQVYIPPLDGHSIYDIDALSGSSGPFHRDKKRVAPHNAFASTQAIRRLAQKRGAPALLPDGIGVRPFTDDLPASQRPPSGSITVSYKRGTTSYAYDATTNSYLRSVGGRAQLDVADGKRVTARNVVVLFMRVTIDPQSGKGHARPVLAHIGTGKALVFHDGHVYPGTFSKRTAQDVTRFIGADGKEIPLVRGRIFIQVVKLGTHVTYRATT